MGINKSVPGIKNSEQNNANWSFDEDFGINAVEPVVYNPSTGALDRMVQPTTPNDTQLSELIPVFRAILQAIANPSYVDKSANAIRNQVQSGTITTVTTVTTVTNMGTWPGGQLSFTASQNTWANMCRSLIT